MARPSEFDSAGGSHGRSLGIAVLIVLLAVLAFLVYGNATAKPIPDGQPGGDGPSISDRETTPSDTSAPPAQSAEPASTDAPLPAQPGL